MAWIYLLASGACEVIGVVGFARISRGQLATGLPIAAIAFSIGLVLLHFAMQTLPMAVAYGVFTGIGTLGSTALGIAFWGDSARPARLAWIAGVVVSVIGLKLTI